MTVPLLTKEMIKFESEGNKLIYFYKCWIETDCSSPTNCDWHVVTYKYEVQCFDCHSEGDLMCMQAFRIILYWAGAFLSVAWPTGVQLLVFFCSSVPVVLFDTPGISRCRSQHVSVESSSLLHHSIYL